MTLITWLTSLLGPVWFRFLLFRFYLFFLFVLQWLSLHWDILIMLLSQFPLTLRQTQKWKPSFITKIMNIIVLIGMAFVIIWETIHGRIFKLGGPAATSEFCEWIQVGIDVYIPHCKYQLKPHSSPCFSAALRNSFFRLYQKNKFSESKGNFRQTVIVAKGLLKLPNLHMLPKFTYANNKTRQSITYRNLVLGTFGRLLIVFWNKVNLL